jgi:hypothetical protein
MLRRKIMRYRVWVLAAVAWVIAGPGMASAEQSVTLSTPEAVVRESVLANERCDLDGMARLSSRTPTSSPTGSWV